MKKNILMIISALICGIVFTSCNSEKPDLKYENEILYGKWQLREIIPTDLEDEDIRLPIWTTLNIIYEFKENNVLTVSADVDITGYEGLEVGNHHYKVTHTNISNGVFVTDLPQHIVRINTEPYYFIIGHWFDEPALFLQCEERNRLFILMRK